MAPEPITQASNAEPVAQTPAPTPQGEQTPQQATRAEIYQRYYGDTPAPTPPVTPEPVAPPPVVEPPATPTPDITGVVAALQQEIASLKTALQAKPQEAPAPTVPPVVPDPNAPPEWIELIRQGKFKEAEAFIVDKAQQTTTPVAVERAVAETLELIKIQNGVEQFLTKLRTDNPDIVPMEKYLRPLVEARLEKAKSSGQITDSNTFLKVYQDSVNAEVEDIRKISQQFRAAGKTEAMTTQKTVLAASTPAPQAVNTERVAAPAEPEFDTTESYLAKRVNAGKAMRGLAV